jgi:hypothetical protein
LKKDINIRKDFYIYKTITFLSQTGEKNMKAAKIIAAVVLVVLGFLAGYLFLPAINLLHGDIYWFVFFMLLLATAVYAVIEYFEDEEYIITKIMGIATGVVLIVIIIGGITSAKMFHADSYKAIADVEVENFSEDFPDVTIQDINDVAIVDLDTARRLGDRTIGNIEHASWYEVDPEYNLIMYNGEAYRISPLNYGGFFKYQKAGSIPGYVLVNARTQEATFVESEMLYSPSAYFSYDLTRHLRNNYSSYKFGKSYMEIDDEGRPFWVTTVKKSTVGLFGGKKVVSVIVTDAKTGECTEYTIDSIPEWVDHAFELDYLMDIAYYHFEYVNGFWNFSKTGIYRTTYTYRSNNSEDKTPFYGYNSFINKDGNVCFYTGLTPANKAETNVGFILLDTRTGKISQYEIAGAEESSAQSAAEGLVQNLGYTSTFPTMINVDGNATYLMALKDKAGLIQRYALVNMQNYTIAVESETLEGAIDKYLNKMGMSSDSEAATGEEHTATVKIREIYTAEIEGTTVFYYLFENDDKLYKASILLNESQILFKVGDTVSITYVEGGNYNTVTNISA